MQQAGKAGDAARAADYEVRMGLLTQALETAGWDGGWSRCDRIPKDVMNHPSTDSSGRSVSNP